MKRLLFDLENTLIKWKDEYTIALQKTIEEFNIDIDYHVIDAVIEKQEKTHDMMNKEVLLNDINEEINLPSLTFIKQVTNDESFRNHSLAKTLSFPDVKDFVEQQLPWIYETGKEEPEILGSGSKYYNVITTKDEQKAFKEATDGHHNYLIRYKKKDGITIARQWYDGYSKSWIDD